MMSWTQLGLQDGASPVMEEVVFFHDFTMVVVVFILSFVAWAMVGAVSGQLVDTGLLEGQAVECVWTIVPALILTQVAIPSLALLYLLDEGLSPSMTLKVVGHQWYWSYEYSDFWRSSGALEFDSYMEPSLGAGPRLLSADNRAVLPALAEVRALIGSADVLHAWSVPSMGVKADACPGRLNQTSFTSLRAGVFYGQCSEICGANHSFMPISLEVVPVGPFLRWLNANLN